MIKEDILTKQKKQQRTSRVRKKIRIKAPGMLRLSVFASNKFFYAQIIDDAKAETLVAVTEKEIEVKDAGTKVQKAEELGMLVAKKALEKKIKSVVFDKGSYKYHGRVKAFAESARKGGLQF